MKKSTAQKLLKFSEEEYDTYAREFSDSRPFFWRELEHLNKFIKNGDKILDIGCGNGRLLNLFKGVEIDYTGIDSSKELIEIAKKNHGNERKFIHANALSLPFQDKTFDTVFSIAVLHHVPSKKFRRCFITEVNRVLKPKGTLVLTVWNIRQWRFLKTHLLHFIKKIIGRSDLDFGDTIIYFGQKKRERYVHAFSKRSLCQLLEKNGFTVSSITEARRQSGYANFVVIAQKK